MPKKGAIMSLGIFLLLWRCEISPKIPIFHLWSNTNSLIACWGQLWTLDNINLYSRVVALRATKVWISDIFSGFSRIFPGFSGFLRFYCAHVNQLAESFNLICNIIFFRNFRFFRIFQNRKSGSPPILEWSLGQAGSNGTPYVVLGSKLSKMLPPLSQM